MIHSKKLMPAILLGVYFIFAFSLYPMEGEEKKVLTIEDYARWRTIATPIISDDGNWIGFVYQKHKDDDLLYVKNLETDKEVKIERASRPQFSDDSRWVAYAVSLPFKEAEKLRKDKKPVPEKAELMNLSTGEKFAWEKVSSFLFAKGSKFFAVKKTKPDPKAKHKGSDLIFRNLEKGYEEHIGSVGEFQFNKPGTMLAYTVDATDKSGNGVYMVYLNTGERRTLDNGEAEYMRLVWDEKGSALAVLKGTKDKELVEKDNILLAFTGLSGESLNKVEYTPADDPNFPENMVISERVIPQRRRRRGASGVERRSLFWSEDRSRVFCGIKEQEKEPEKKEEDADPVANVDVFHWNDERIQTVQIAQAETDRNYTYRSVLNLSDKQFVRLTDEKMRRISITKNGKWGIGEDEKAYISDWKERRADYYRVNTATGECTLMFKAQGQTLGLSPDSKHFLYWKDGHVWVCQIESGEMRTLTETSPVSFVNKEYDHPGTKPPYGVAGWTKDEKAVILEHRYDLWLQPLDGSQAMNLTGGTGDKEEIRFRYVSLDPEEKFIDLAKPILLSAYGEWTKKAGYFELRNGKLARLVYDDKHFSNLRKAKNATRFIYTMETFVDFPNYYISDVKFSSARQMTDANPWQSEYKWGHRILFDYTNKAGVRLQGTLAIPDDYESGQRLPMLVNFYEKRSQELHRYSIPQYSSRPQFAAFVSNGYLAMQLDVHLNTRTTHDDMLDCVEASTRKVIEMGYADPEHIGLQGGSFSGGGSCYISTRSKMFAAIAARAAPINLVGEFNILFRGNGRNNHQYDIYGQGRYGTNPYDDFELYRTQSPITYVRTMDTPLLYLHGTDDGSVEYLQGMEFYNALRFNGKPIIFLSYPGEGHSLQKLENQKDFTARLWQFFDHYLKGKPAPDWMVNGVPHLKKKWKPKAPKEKH